MKTAIHKDLLFVEVPENSFDYVIWNDTLKYNQKYYDTSHFKVSTTHISNTKGKFLGTVTATEGDPVFDFDPTSYIESWIEERMRSKPTHYRVYHQDTPEDPAFFTSDPKDSFLSLVTSLGLTMVNEFGNKPSVTMEVCNEGDPLCKPETIVNTGFNRQLAAWQSAEEKRVKKLIVIKQI